MLGTFLLDTGFRFSEAFKFTLVNGKASLRAGTTKNDKGRQVSLTARVAGCEVPARLAHPREARRRHPTEGCMGLVLAPLAAGDQGGPVRGRDAAHPASPCASRLVQRGVSLYVVKEWLGHSSIKVTERYAHLAQYNLSGALAALEGKPVGVVESPSREVTTCHATAPEGEAV
jgi:integrase